MTHTQDGPGLDWLALPERLEQSRLPMPDATADFLQVAQLANLLTSLFWGTNDFYVSPEHRLAAAHGATDHLVARRADGADAHGRIVGFAALGAAPGPARLWVGVHPDFRRRGVGSALLAAAEAEAARRGATGYESWTDNALVDPAAVGSGPVFVRGTSLETGLTPVLPPAGRETGPDAGPVRSGAPDAAFAAAHGYAPDRLEWCSVLDLRGAAGPALQAESAAGLEGEYEVLGGEGDLPREHAATLPDLGPGRRGLAVVAVDRRTGRAVGHAVIETTPDLPHVAYARGPVVAAGHRGRGLELLLRAVVVSRLLRSRPGAERLYAWRAAEDEAARRDDEALGLVPVATRACWRKAVPGTARGSGPAAGPGARPAADLAPDGRGA